jgi:hypothetical protein
MIACSRAIGRLGTGGGLHRSIHRRAFIRACSAEWDAAAAAPPSVAPSALGRRSVARVANPTLRVAAAAAAAAATAATVAACEAPDDGDGTETFKSTTAESATGISFANDLAVPGSAPLQLMGRGCRWKWSVVKVGGCLCVGWGLRVVGCERASCVCVCVCVCVWATCDEVWKGVS